MKEEIYYKLKSGMIISKNILAVVSRRGTDERHTLPSVIFTDNSVVIITQDDYEELKELL